MKKMFKLGDDDVPEDMANIAVQHDMTPAERETDRELRKQAKENTVHINKKNQVRSKGPPLGERNNKNGTERKAPHPGHGPGFGRPKLSMIKVIYTNADVLTSAKLIELKNLIQENTPEIIAITEVKPKNFSRVLTPLEYQLQNYNLEFEGLTQEDGGRGIFIYIHESLQYN